MKASQIGGKKFKVNPKNDYIIWRKKQKRDTITARTNTMNKKLFDDLVYVYLIESLVFIDKGKKING